MTKFGNNDTYDGKIGTPREFTSPRFSDEAGGEGWPVEASRALAKEGAAEVESPAPSGMS